MAGSVAPNITTDSLVLDLDAANYKSYTSGSTLWYDLTSTSNSGSLTNGPTYSTSGSGCIVFDGVDDYVNITPSLFSTLTNNFTVCVWYQGLTGNRPFLVLAGSGGASGFVIEAYSNNTWKVTKYGVVDIYIGTPTSDNLWHQLVLVYSSTAGTLVYVDGVLNSSSANTSNLKPSPFCYLGRGENGYLNGKIPQMQVYNRVLTADEIFQNYRSMKPRYSP
jgi:hypothetical protein